MKAPAFWQRPGGLAALLAPASLLWSAAGRLRRALTTPYQPSVPLIAVGNPVAGGAGKTPVVLALAVELARMGRSVGLLSRGHGGQERGPLQVDPDRHTAAEVGDEPLLLARAAPTVIARDRAAGARTLEALGIDVIVMDDGLQNPAIRPSTALLVVDGGFGFGNGRVMPAGPLREPLADALARVDAVVVVGADTTGVAEPLVGTRPIHHARLEPVPGTERLAGRRLLAFAGIGRPAKFFDTLQELGATLVDGVAFADHHRFTELEIMALVDRAQALDATPITTEKDAVRLPPGARAMVETLPVALVWRDPVPITAWLERVTAG